MQKSRLFAMCEQAIVSVSNFVFTVLLSRYLPVMDFGFYSIGFTIFVILQGFQRAVISIPISILYGRGGLETISYKVWGLLNRVMTFSVILVGVLVGLFSYFFDLDDAVWKGAVSAVLVYAGMASYEFNRRVLIQKKLIHKLLPVALVYCLACFAFVLFFVSRWNNFFVAVLSLFAASGLAALYSEILFRKNTICDSVSKKGDLKILFAGVIKYARWGAASHVVFSAYNGFVPLALGFLVGPSATALMHVTKNLMQPVQTLITAIDSVDKPRAASAFDKNGCLGLVKALRSTLVFLLVLGGGYILIVSYFGSDLMSALYGARYADAGELIVLWGVVFLLIIITQPIESGLYVGRVPHYLFLGRVVSAVVGVGCVYFLVPIYGVNGGMYALILGWLTSTFASSFAFVKFYFSANQACKQK
jgi:O-antigen/teichoic acid export membrane protein